MLALVTAALAHHDTAVTQVGAASPTLDWDGTRGPSMSVDAAYGFSTFSRTLRGSTPWPAATGSVTVHTLTIAGHLQLATGTGVHLAMPAGLTFVQSPSATDKLRGGPGDVRLAVDQRMGPLTARLGMSAPTGTYDATPVLSVVDVSTETTEVRLTTYDTRANLGSGAWTALGGLDLRAIVGRFDATASMSAQLPFTDTPDAIRWGPTGSAALGAETEVHARVRVGLALDGRHHLPDHMDTVDEDTGGPRVAKFGTRSAIGASATAWVTPASGTRCGVRVHVPLWQHVAGIQLVETVSAGLTCQHTRSLARGE